VDRGCAVTALPIRPVWAEWPMDLSPQNDHTLVVAIGVTQPGSAVSECSAIANVFVWTANRKGKPPVREGRKATGLSESAGPPNGVGRRPSYVATLLPQGLEGLWDRSGNES
jgi:hypothetical protein